MPHSERAESPVPTTERTLRSGRNPRRRARVESESIKVAPRRKRSKITESTFVPRNDDVEEEEEPVSQTNGHRAASYSSVSHSRKVSGPPSGDFAVPVRSARYSSKRVHRDDNATILTQNNNYNVKLLSSTPKFLVQEGVDFRGSISAVTNLALAITKEKACVFDYTGYGGSGQTRIIDVPFHTSLSDPPPFAQLVSNGNSSDHGILFVSSTHGKIVFHESIERVTSLNFFQERQKGVEGTIPGLFSGEKIVQLSSAEAAGYVALLNSGRIVHITLRDHQGRSKVQAQFLYATEQASGGLFGSIKSMFGTSTWKQAVCAVRVRPMERGQVQVLAALEKGEIRTWQLDWNGSSEFRGTTSVREQLEAELRQMGSAETQSQLDHVEVKDLAILDSSSTQGSELVPFGSSKPFDVLLLVASGSPTQQSHHLVHYTLNDNTSTIRRILEVRSDSHNSEFARLLVPASGHTAHVILGNTVVVISLAVSASNPEAQFHEASYIEPEPFQDSFCLKKGMAFLGADADHSRTSGDAVSILYVKQAGLVRLTTSHKAVEAASAAESVKSKIEQVIFYGTNTDNILDLAQRSETRATVEEVEAAALAISELVMQSDGNFFKMPPTTIEANLLKRTGALHALAEHLKKFYPPLSTGVKWQLLRDAEHVAVASQLWSTFQAHLSQTNHGKKRATLFHEVAAWMSDKYNVTPLSQDGAPEDRVRTMFVKLVDHIEDILPAARTILKQIREDGNHSEDEIIELTSEADEIWLDCLETAFAFRTTNIALYGLKATSIEDGILTDPAELQDAPELWTSTESMIKEVVRMTTLSRQSASTIFEDEGGQSPEIELMCKKVAVENERLLVLCCLVYSERIAWYQSRNDPKSDDKADKLKAAFDEMRHDQIRAQANLGNTERGMKLAERYRDMRTLTEMCIAEAQWLTENMVLTPISARNDLYAKLNELDKRVSQYFSAFGEDWSEAYFSEYLSNAHAGSMLQDVGTKYKAPLTRFLRKRASRAKVCWIHDVLDEKDFGHAGGALLDAASKQETNIWSKKVELSLAKLSLLASNVSAEAVDGPVNERADAELKVVRIQDRFYGHVVPETYTSLDDEASVNAAMSVFGNQVADLEAHYQTLADLIGKLLAHEVLSTEELVDALTESDYRLATSVDDVEWSPTFEALQAYQHIENYDSRELALKMIWKRAYLREDWAAINGAARTNSEAEMRDMLSSTRLYDAVKLSQQAKLTDPNTGAIVLTPAETLGAGCHVDDLPNYIASDFAERFLEENVLLERKLESLINDQQLSSWVDDVQRYAREELLKEAEVIDVPDESIMVNGNGMNGHLANGTPGEIKTEETEDDLSFSGLQSHGQDMEME